MSPLLFPSIALRQACSVVEAGCGPFGLQIIQNVRSLSVSFLILKKKMYSAPLELAILFFKIV